MLKFSRDVDFHASARRASITGRPVTTTTHPGSTGDTATTRSGQNVGTARTG